MKCVGTGLYLDYFALGPLKYLVGRNFSASAGYMSTFVFQNPAATGTRTASDVSLGGKVLLSTYYDTSTNAALIGPLYIGVQTAVAGDLFVASTTTNTTSSAQWTIGRK